jgi:hypothetical protein
MEIEQAKKEVVNIGAAYFYDDLDRFTVNQIISRIVSEILQATKLRGLHYSEITRDAFSQVVEELDQEELDQILLHDYALRPEQVNGSRAFFHGLAMEMDKAIREVKPRLTE